MKNLYFLLFTTILLSSCRVSNNEKKKTSTTNTHTNNELTSIINAIKQDASKHLNIEKKLTDDEVSSIEKKIGKSLPETYKYFLKTIGAGAELIYYQPIDDIRRYSYLSSYRELNQKIELVNEKYVPSNSLLCLMSEDSNGGSWVWLTSEKKENNEWSLAYFDIKDQKLYFKVTNFTEWLKLLYSSKGEVIRELDKNHILGLG
ncbi:SMI1/KNR4 family protein [Tenacibaculum jejuense]|uniref:Probable lipoprotein n=1 Tax=Tenacibaculum jejuense TaxID=584609 RepID=A0A238UGC5_9FLAO|nr:SMI1/KNR4 family protein [Tenacibaculum jejuense]SNR17598.1 Probable lipoprotein precursor [Tenacibaculum jejuense]